MPDMMLPTELEKKVQEFNRFFPETNGQQLQCVQEDGDIVAEGLLKVNWGVKKQIQLKRKDNVPVPTRHRRRLSAADISYDSDEENKIKQVKSSSKRSTQLRDYRPRRRKEEDDEKQPEDSTDAPAPTPLDVKHQSATVGRRKGRAAIKKRYSINGYVYNHLTSVFTPQYGTITTIRVSSNSLASDVIDILMEKFKIENPSSSFALFVCKENGERRRLQDTELPLITRLLLGPDEDAAKLFIMDRDACRDVPLETAQYLNLTEVELQRILQKFSEEEERERIKIVQKYAGYKAFIRYRLLEANRRLSTGANKVEEGLT